MWKRVLGYGALLAAGTLALSWLDYQRLARTASLEIYLFLLAAGASWAWAPGWAGGCSRRCRPSPSMAIRRPPRSWA